MNASIRAGRATKEGIAQERSDAWSSIIKTHSQDMKELIDEEKEQWREATEKIEEEILEGDWDALWPDKKTKD